MSMIPVADPVWGWTLSAYSQVFITLISIYIFRSYLCKEPALCSLGRKELKYCVWAAVIGVGICLGHRALLLFFLDFVEKSLRDIGGVSISNNAVFVNTLPGILYTALLGPATEDIFYRGAVLNKLWDFEGSFAFAPIGIGILLLVFGILMLRRETRKVAWQIRAEKGQ